MTYPFVHAHADYGPAKGPRLAVTWHMAEGHGTVAYLTKENPNGVSVHFVVERSGRIVQMLQLDHANGSIRPTAIRVSDDKPYLWKGVPIRYGATAAGEVLGVWHRDPNSATLGVEVEGFAKDGPNADQAEALARLWADLASRFPGIRPLAHRDFADYKGCPGHRFPWDRVGGHGLEVIAMPVAVNGTDRTLASSHVRDVKAGTTFYRDTEGSVLTKAPKDLVVDDFGYPVTGGGWVHVLVRSAGFDEDADQEVGLALVKASEAGPVRRKTPAELEATAGRYAKPDCATAIADAIATDRAKARVTWEEVPA